MEVVSFATAVVLVGLTALLAPGLRFLMAFLRTKSLLRSTTIPGPEITDFLKGHVDTLMSDQVHAQLSDWTDKYGPIFRLQVAHHFAVVVTDPAAAIQLLRKGSPEYLQKSRAMYAAMEVGVRPIVSNILSSQDSPYWKAVRTGLAPCFSLSNLRKLFPRLQALTAAALEVVAAAAAGGQEVDVADLAKRVTSDVMGSMLLDQDFGGVEMRPDPYMEFFNAMVREAHAHICNPLRWYMIWDAEARQGWDVIVAYDKALEQKLSAAFKTPPPEHTVAGHLFKVKDPATGQPLTMPHLKAELAVVLGAGFETTSHAITWIMAALATHPGVQAKLAEELSAAGLTSREFDWGDLARLPYLNAVIKESLRLFSPASMGTMRVAHTDITICNHAVPKGTLVFFPMGPIGTSTHTYGPDAHCFVPERWLPTSAAAAAGAAASGQGQTGEPGAAAAAAASGSKEGPPDPLTFSYGPRDCIGQALAKMELQVVVASLVAKFDFTPGAVLQGAVSARCAQVGGPAVADERLQVSKQVRGGECAEQGMAAAVIKGICDLAQFHITLGPKQGMLLVATPRA